jgi:hypothetical protein
MFFLAKSVHFSPIEFNTALWEPFNAHCSLWLRGYEPMVGIIWFFRVRLPIHTPIHLGLSTLTNAGLLIAHFFSMSYVCPSFTFGLETTYPTVRSTDLLNIIVDVPVSSSFLFSISPFLERICVQTQLTRRRSALAAVPTPWNYTLTGPYFCVCHGRVLSNRQLLALLTVTVCHRLTHTTQRTKQNNTKKLSFIITLFIISFFNRHSPTISLPLVRPLHYTTVHHTITHTLPALTTSLPFFSHSLLYRSLSSCHFLYDQET